MAVKSLPRLEQSSKIISSGRVILVCAVLAMIRARFWSSQWLDVGNRSTRRARPAGVVSEYVACAVGRNLQGWKWRAGRDVRDDASSLPIGYIISHGLEDSFFVVVIELALPPCSSEIASFGFTTTSLTRRIMGIVDRTKITSHFSLSTWYASCQVM